MTGKSLFGNVVNFLLLSGQTQYADEIFGGSLKAKMGVVTPRTVKPTAVAITKRRREGSGVMNSWVNAFMDSCLRMNENAGRNIARLSTAGKSTTKRIIQGFTCTEPKQPQGSAPVMPL